ncbi:hypothetical protein Milano_058 [Agrobacterium phage Milano]|nr:hypothetical protein Milano_058 [Agrobacterium phage Milano]
MFKLNIAGNWYQSEIKGGNDGMWLFVRRPGDYKAVPLFYQETMGL